MESGSDRLAAEIVILRDFLKQRELFLTKPPAAMARRTEPNGRRSKRKEAAVRRTTASDALCD
ncbi:MAG: hypothetical protein AB8B91_20950 [Rubripirellula sp.]